jgi:hypothetical protein
VKVASVVDEVASFDEAELSAPVLSCPAGTMMTVLVLVEVRPDWSVAT